MCAEASTTGGSKPVRSGRSRKCLLRLKRNKYIKVLITTIIILFMMLASSCSASGPPADWSVPGRAAPDQAALGGGAAVMRAAGMFAPVAWVNGEPVTSGEFKTRMLELRGEAVAEAAEKGANPGARNFWAADIGGRTPLDLLKEKTLHLLIRVKVQELAARKAGIVQDIGYEAFLLRLDAENRLRSSRLRSGEPIYGPQQYSERVYYRYMLANLELALRERLARAEGESSGKLLDEGRYEAWLEGEAAAAEVRTNPALYGGLSAD
ncbi:hypothetical protein KIH86_13450 [Paenibacillus sp. HN-1]|uniref:hypothetical protein n=1 Tax=Paenibacillus TaxID=44249 RepID=UPI001CA94F02|nr:MULTISPECIES: hypothetical protein [Paenibacillus]MBY9080775.1 hypothetical protein [Paenibacillus sp. CGMCC 1.18879]MBY9085233.1 hypothetical protein [Paenibacillus sinensis]